ncbi:MAG: site-2 protease family protein [Methanomassiliicoccales archaeon]|jgi:Zn-dependent protease|nr:site-2 protease family protein [Methanomassiliicoccales archaeon]
MIEDHTIYLYRGYRRIRFGKLETLHILLAVIVLTFAFAIVLTASTAAQLDLPYLDAFGYSIGISFLIVLTGFLLHELAHKFVAQRNGAWAEFRVYPFGLILALAFAFLGFVFAAPGAVYIQGHISRRQNGIISISGPLTNLVVGAMFLAFWFLAPPSSIFAFILRWIGTINLLLAAFNLISVPPLDGSKVIRWSVPIFVVVFVITIALLLVGLEVIVV